jgi:hypothetical protein
MGLIVRARMKTVATTLHELESPPSLWLGLCAWVLPSLCRVSGEGCVLGFRRVFAESPAWVVRLGFAESPWPALGFSQHEQAVRCNRRLRPSLISGSPPPVHPL